MSQRSASSAPSRHLVEQALTLALRAPSVHNTQPWRWLVGERSLHLFRDTTRQAHAVDPAGRDLLVSCGAALHHARIALAAAGWECEVTRMPSETDPDHLAALVPHRREPAPETVALAAAIRARHSDRRPYTSWPVPPGHLDLIVRRAAAQGAVAVPVTAPAARHRLAVLMAEAAVTQDRDPAYRRELAVWAGRAGGPADGVRADAAAQPAGDYGDVTMRRFPGAGRTDPADRRRDPDAAELIVIATPGDDPVSLVRAGEAASAATLTATDLRLASCLLSQPVEVDSARARIAREVLGGTALPHLVLRVGWPAVAGPPVPVSRRRSLAEVAAPLPGTRPAGTR